MDVKKLHQKRRREHNVDIWEHGEPTKHTTDLRNVLSNHFEEKKPIVTVFKNCFTTVEVELESAIQNPDNRH